MKHIHKIILISMICLMSTSLVTARDVTPQGDFHGQEFYSIKNFTNINGTSFFARENITAGSYFLGDGSLLTGVNTSFNQSLTDLLYAGIEWDYNQTTATYNIYNTAWSSTYNATYAGSLNNESYLSTYNSTYDTWAYNQTIPANSYTDSVNSSLSSWVTSTFLSIANALTQYFNKTDIQTQYYNKTDIDSFNTSWSSTYNGTYHSLVSQNASLWSEALDKYNLTYESTYNASYITTDTNESVRWNIATASPCSGTDKMSGFYPNGSINCTADSGASTYNSTYATWAYNQTTPAIEYFDARDGNNTYNSSYQLYNFTDTINAINTSGNIETVGSALNDTTWSYNQTTPAISYGDATFRRLDQNVTANQINKSSGTSFLNELLDSILDKLNISTSNIVRDYLNSSDQRYNETSLVIQVNDTTVQRNDWTTIDSYPTACSAGEYIGGLGDTLTCITETISNETDLLNSINTTGNINSLIDADTNASSCSDGEYLDGTGRCINLNTTITDASSIYNETTLINAVNTTGNINALIDADTNASTICNSDEVLKGDATCQNITDFNETAWVESQSYLTTYDNATSICAGEEYLGGDGGCYNLTDTNVSSICGDNEVLLGQDTKLCVNLNTTIDARENDTIYTNGSGLSLVGTEFNHSDTSSQASSDNTLNTFIQDIVLDTYGHITSIVTATLTNIFDQYLNTTSNVVFARINATAWDNVSITESQVSDLAHTVDTNASTICSGTTTYLDGETNCDDISDVYVDESGDTMQGNLAFGNYNATGLDYLKFTGGGYAYDNGTALILGHS